MSYFFSDPRRKNLKYVYIIINNCGFRERTETNALPTHPLLPSGIRPPANPKGLPFEIFSDIQFWLTDRNGGAHAKKRTFLVKIFQKVSKNAFLPVLNF